MGAKNMTTGCLDISPEAFEAFVAEQTEGLRALVDGQSKGITPQFTILTRDMDGTEGMVIAMLAVDFNEDHEKQMVLTSLGKKMYDEQKFPLAVSLISEGWMAPQEKGVQPRDNPEKKEVVMAAIANADNSLSRMICHFVKRDEQDMMSLDAEHKPEDIKAIRMPILGYFWRGFLSKALSRMKELVPEASEETSATEPG